MKLSLDELINMSNESVLKDCHYSDGMIHLVMDVDQLDSTITLKAKTKYLALNIPEQIDLAYRTCFIELTNLLEFLETENGIFVPKNGFSDFMQQKRQNLNLAYGLKQKDYQFILSLTGTSKLVSFVIRNKEDVYIEYSE